MRRDLILITWKPFCRNWDTSGAGEHKFCVSNRLNFDDFFISTIVSQLQHIPYGRINGMSTRTGNVVLLEDILNEAKQQAIESTRKTKSKFNWFQFWLILVQFLLSPVVPTRASFESVRTGVGSSLRRAWHQLSHCQRFQASTCVQLRVRLAADDGSARRFRNFTAIRLFTTVQS